MLGTTPQLALPVEFLFEILFVGAHTPTCIVCRNWKSNFSLLGPLTRIEKSLLQAHFRLVNYCQYNFVEHRTLIFHAYGDSIKSNHLPTELSFCKIK
ncbi:hypothetical protein CRU83_12935 [Staphylococcus aureus]|nr:hypothetical protein CRU83_12935 [Staphylococcus aureus]